MAFSICGSTVWINIITVYQQNCVMFDTIDCMYMSVIMVDVIHCHCSNNSNNGEKWDEIILNQINLTYVDSAMIYRLYLSVLNTF